MEYSIRTQNLTKKYDDFLAVKGLDLNIPRGKIFGFLGPNGAGKTTTISMLATILAPTSGTATIEGYDLIKDRDKIRWIIGLCPQSLVLYDKLTARENLRLFGRMFLMENDTLNSRIDDLLGKMNLLEKADKLVGAYSGGMKRRLNVIMAVISDPQVIFFDEPSAGLDPQSRRVVWDFIREFEKEKKTVILTTHNMEEADDLSDLIAIIDNGEIIAEGTPQELKGRIGKGDIIEFKTDPFDEEIRANVIEYLRNLNNVISVRPLGKERIKFNALEGLKNISEFYNGIKSNFNVEMKDIVIRQNTLEDIFIELTGKSLRD